MIFGWSCRGQTGESYQLAEDVNLVNKRRVVLHFLLLDRLHCVLLFGLTVLGQVDDAEATLSKLGLE